GEWGGGGGGGGGKAGGGKGGRRAHRGEQVDQGGNDANNDSRHRQSPACAGNIGAGDRECPGKGKPRREKQGGCHIRHELPRRDDSGRRALLHEASNGTLLRLETTGGNLAGASPIKTRVCPYP